MYRYTFLLIKKYLLSPFTYIIFFFPLIILIGLSQLMPVSILLSSSITIGVMASIMVLFGGQIQEARRTSFFKTLAISSISKTKLLVTNLFVSLLFTTILIIFTISFTFFLDSLGLMTHDFTNLLSNSQYAWIMNIFNFSINWNGIDYFNLLYAIIVTAIFTYSLTFLIVSFVKVGSIMNTLFILYLVVMILFGGILIPVPILIISNSFSQYFYYLVPSYYTNQLITASLMSDSTPPIIAGISNISPEIGNFIEKIDIPQFKDWNWDFIQNDIDYINSLFNNTYDKTKDLYESVISYDYESSIFKLLTTDIPVAGTIIKQLVFSSNGMTFLPLDDAINNLHNFQELFQFMVDNKRFLVSYQNSTTMWDFSSIESMVVCFGPILIIAIFDIISLKTFSWNVR